jgi:predicted site-specific integrase-resolvase
MNEYIPTKKARKILGVTTQTLRKWDSEGKINTIRAPSNVRLYCVKDMCDIINYNLLVQEKKKIAYCRVSSKKQENDLERQKDFFRLQFPDYELVTDIGSGINFKRKGLQTILERSMQGDISEIMVTHKDRLCRFGFELLEWIFKKYNVTINILDRNDGKSESEELSDDILSIIHIFSCKQMGRRRYSNKKNKDLSNSETKEDI